jgi:hypothetical protein
MMTIAEPALARTKQGPHWEGRWRWWYSSIADHMIRNPGTTFTEIAAALNKNPNTISAITGTDMFREYLARRKQEFQREHDYAIRAKLTGVAEASLDIMLSQLQKKGEQIPMQRLENVVSMTLDRLGYAPASTPSVVVNNNTDARTQTVAIQGLTPLALEEARQALRLAELRHSGSSLSMSAPLDPVDIESPGAESPTAVVPPLEG